MDSVSKPDGVTGKLCNWIANIKYSDIPEHIKERAKYLLLDGIACALVGAHLPWSETAVNALLEYEDTANNGPYTLIGWPDRHLSPMNASLLNSTFIQGFELDDWHFIAPLHSNAILLSSLLALADRSLVQALSYRNICASNF
ncbi:unnamed protein product [Didymodactylos carnosus]|uniref:MmgE/PrpD N-terminal domain-containing protein n=1 Tax=Didymodactylos carnosus TaxID=1234261 RepID=A0A8S2FB00_9BILA|nr:unnamed protein product [Didymodactylos carnosus]CAF4211944.1 unnamed protein product [Didymodactylos carnosus]